MPQDGVEKDASVDLRHPEIGNGRSTKINPLRGLRLIFYKDISLILFMASSFYAVYYCVQTTISVIYSEEYNFNTLEIGLAYLPGGFGVILGAALNGKFMDYNYAITAKGINHEDDRVIGDDIDRFPIERARSRGAYYLLIIYSATVIGYGWAIRFRVHFAVLLVLQAILGILCTWSNATFSTLLVDVYAASPSMAAATGNITRCALSAILVAIMQPIVSQVGRGWFFTILGVFSGAGGIVVIAVMRVWSMSWRQARREKENEKSKRNNNILEAKSPDKVVEKELMSSTPTK